MIRHALIAVTILVLIGIATQGLHAYPGDAGLLMHR